MKRLPNLSTPMNSWSRVDGAKQFTKPSSVSFAYGIVVTINKIHMEVFRMKCHAFNTKHQLQVGDIVEVLCNYSTGSEPWEPFPTFIFRAY